MKNYILRKLTTMKIIYRLCRANNQSLYETLKLMTIVFENPNKLHNKKLKNNQ